GFGGFADFCDAHGNFLCLNVYQCAFVFAAGRSLERAGLVDRKHLDGQFLIAAQREGRGVHDLEPAHDGLVEADARVARGGRILVGVGTVDAIDLGRLEHDLGADLGAAQRGGRVGGEEGVARAGRENDDLALFQVAQRLGTDVGLDHLVDVERRLHARVDVLVLEGVLQGQGIHDGGHHAHVVGGGAVHALRAGSDAPENVAATDDDGQLYAQRDHFGDLVGHAHDGAAVDAEGILAHQRLAGKFEKNPFV